MVGVGRGTTATDFLPSAYTLNLQHLNQADSFQVLALSS